MSLWWGMLQILWKPRCRSLIRSIFEPARRERSWLRADLVQRRRSYILVSIEMRSVLAAAGRNIGIAMEELRSSVRLKILLSLVWRVPPVRCHSIFGRNQNAADVKTNVGLWHIASSLRYGIWSLSGHKGL